MKKLSILSLLVICYFFVPAQEKVDFSKSFKTANQGKYKIEINEVKELLHIMLAITPSGLTNDDMVNQQGQYYKDVISHFKRFGGEKIISTFDSLLNSSLYNYIFLTGNGISYDFVGNKLMASPTYIFPATTVAGVTIKSNPVAKYLKDIEVFALKTQFRKFYKSHKGYYDSIVYDYNKNANLGRQWSWLERHFVTKINSYVIFCSPLINGLNYTGEFNNNNFRLIYMVLPPLDKDAKLSELDNEIFNTRIMFSEIDHNYVSAPSAAYATTIDSVFASRKAWVNEKASGTSAYPTPEKVFNEYMTYAVFLLYCKDQYPTEFDRTRKGVIALMSDRGFPKMEFFCEALLAAKETAGDKKIDGLYPSLLELLAKSAK